MMAHEVDYGYTIAVIGFPEILVLVADLYAAVTSAATSTAAPATAEVRAPGAPPRTPEDELPSLPHEAQLTVFNFARSISPILATTDDDEFAWRIEEETAAAVAKLHFRLQDILPIALFMREGALPAAADTLTADLYGLTAAKRMRESTVVALNTIRKSLGRFLLNSEAINSPLVFVSAADARSSDIPLPIAESNHRARAGIAATMALIADLTRSSHITRQRAEYLTDLSLRGAHHTARLVALATNDPSFDVARLGTFDVPEAYKATARHWAEIEAEHALS